MISVKTIIYCIIFIQITSFSTYNFNKNILKINAFDVYDGDTFFVDLEGVPDVLGKRIGVRLAGIDTPEIRGKCPLEKELAIEAREFLRELINGKQVELRNITRGKYFRLVADVYVNNENVSNSLLASDLAVRYTGKGKRFDWCKS